MKRINSVSLLVHFSDNLNDLFDGYTVKDSTHLLATKFKIPVAVIEFIDSTNLIKVEDCLITEGVAKKYPEALTTPCYYSEE